MKSIGLDSFSPRWVVRERERDAEEHCQFDLVGVGMDEDQIEGCVSGYLKQKGFAQNDDKLQLSNTDSSLQPNTLNRAQYSLSLSFSFSIYVKL